MASVPDLKQPPPTNKLKQRRSFFTWTGFKGKTLWDWLQLLAALAVPIAVAVGTLWFTNVQSQVTTAASNQQYQTNLRIANDQQQETALQTYLDRMSDLLLTNGLKTSKPGSEVRSLARARTLTILPQLNDIRKRRALQFLYEAGLITAGTDPIISLKGADLSSIDLSLINLSGASLSGAILKNADLSLSQLSNINLSGADLQNADLSLATLDGADLSRSYLSKANLFRTDLSHAILVKTYLSEAVLSGADLTGADLNEANLFHARLDGAKVTDEQLSKAETLEGAQMPDQSIHP